MPKTQEPSARHKEAQKAQQSAQGKAGPKEKRVTFSGDSAGDASNTPSAEVSSSSILVFLPALANLVATLLRLLPRRHHIQSVPVL